MKRCSKCKETKLLNHFYKQTDAKDGLHVMCKPCAKYAARNRELRRYYGMSRGDYNEMFSNQNGCCALCGTHQSQVARTLAVDHCHKTKKIRKLLCHLCNNGLGNFKENIQVMEKAIKYILEYQ